MILEVNQLGCIREQQAIFANVSFQLASGEALLVEGRNGAGKSSLLRLLAGIAMPAQGTIHWQGHLLQTHFPLYCQALHYIGHERGLKLGLTVNENWQLAARLAGSKLHENSSIVECLQLHAYQNTLVRQLSAGQKQRVALAKLFLIPKTIWIVDEPFTALDTATQNFFLMKLAEHLQHGGVSVISSHQSFQLQNGKLHTLRLNAC